MARNLYVMAMEPQSGKSVVTLGLAELVSGEEQIGRSVKLTPEGALLL